MTPSGAGRIGHGLRTKVNGNHSLCSLARCTISRDQVFQPIRDTRSICF
jgi:hypothetical protein